MRLIHANPNIHKSRLPDQAIYWLRPPSRTLMNSHPSRDPGGPARGDQDHKAVVPFRRGAGAFYSKIRSARSSTKSSSLIPKRRVQTNSVCSPRQGPAILNSAGVFDNWQAMPLQECSPISECFRTLKACLNPNWGSLNKSSAVATPPSGSLSLLHLPHHLFRTELYRPPGTQAIQFLLVAFSVEQ